MKSKLIIVTGLISLALLAGCNKAEEAAETKTATTEVAPAAAEAAAPVAAPAAVSAPVVEAAPATPAPASESK
jgi:uncharacterized lipoprotein